MKRTKTRIAGAVILILGLAIALTGVFGSIAEREGTPLSRLYAQASEHKNALSRLNLAIQNAQEALERADKRASDALAAANDVVKTAEAARETSESGSFDSETEVGALGQSILEARGAGENVDAIYEKYESVAFAELTEQLDSAKTEAGRAENANDEAVEKLNALVDAVLLILLGMLVSEIYSSLHLTYLRKQQPVTLPFPLSAGQNTGHMNRNILRIALPVSLTTFFCQSISTLNAVIIPNLLVRSGLEQTAALQRYGILFGMTLPLLMVPFSLINALSIVLLPYLSRCRVLQQWKQILSTLRGSFLAILLFVAPATLGIAAFGTPLGLLCYGQPEVGAYILPLAVGVILSAFEVVLETALNAYNRQTRCSPLCFRFTSRWPTRFHWVCAPMSPALSSLLFSAVCFAPCSSGGC